MTFVHWLHRLHIWHKVCEKIKKWGPVGGLVLGLIIGAGIQEFPFSSALGSLIDRSWSSFTFSWSGATYTRQEYKETPCKEFTLPNHSLPSLPNDPFQTPPPFYNCDVSYTLRFQPLLIGAGIGLVIGIMLAMDAAQERRAKKDQAKADAESSQKQADTVPKKASEPPSSEKNKQD